MHYNTAKKIEAVERSVRRRLTWWQKKHPGVITGVHVGRKETRSGVKRYYSVAFHVVEKLDELPPEYHLPDEIELTLDGERKKMPTDVVETGPGELCAVASGMKVAQVTTSEFGTVGPFATKGDDVFLVSNMHVLGDSFLDRGTTSISVPKSNQLPNIVIIRNGSRPVVASFARGRLSSLIDGAIARVLNPSDIDNTLPAASGTAAGAPQGVRTLTTSEAQTGVSVHLFGAVSRVQSSTTVSRNASKVFLYPTGRLNLHNLIQIKPRFSAKGDSGSVIFDDDRNVLGILVGRDNVFSYAVPIETVLQTFGIQLMT